MGSIAEKWENQGAHQKEQEIAIRLLKKNTSVVGLGLRIEHKNIVSKKVPIIK
jgi:hypothetical protein